MHKLWWTGLQVKVVQWCEEPKEEIEWGQIGKTSSRRGWKRREEWLGWLSDGKILWYQVWDDVRWLLMVFIHSGPPHQFAYSNQLKRAAILITIIVDRRESEMKNSTNRLIPALTTIYFRSNAMRIYNIHLQSRYRDYQLAILFWNFLLQRITFW